MEWAYNDRRALLAHIKQLNEVIAAADLFVEKGHQYSGACITDHYFDRECDCGFEAYHAARAKMESSMTIVMDKKA